MTFIIEEKLQKPDITVKAEKDEKSEADSLDGPQNKHQRSNSLNGLVNDPNY